jgi:hypothetical protein
VIRWRALDLLARLAALVPPPRMHLTRFHGVFAPHSKLRAAVTPAHRDTGAPKQPAVIGEQQKTPTPRHVGNEQGAGSAHAARAALNSRV